MWRATCQWCGAGATALPFMAGSMVALLAVLVAEGLERRALAVVLAEERDVALHVRGVELLVLHDAVTAARVADPVQVPGVVLSLHGLHELLHRAHGVGADEVADRRLRPGSDLPHLVHRRRPVLGPLRVVEAIQRAQYRD